MKITTWNVNGYRAVLKKGFKDSIGLLDPDILCLQEIKAKEEQISQGDLTITDYKCLWNSADRPGYSGVATYYKEKITISHHVLGIDHVEFDQEGRVIRVDIDNISLFNVYFPNGQRGMDRVEFKLNFYSRLLEICSELHLRGREIIITGDFNTAHNEIDLANPKENSKTSGFLPEERIWIDKYLENGFKDAYREMYPGRIQYTWWTYRFTARQRNIGWRLDYYLVSDSLLKKVRDVIVHEEIQGSDHCPVTILID